MPAQIGWSIEAKLLYQIKQEIKKSRESGTVVITTTAAP